MGELDEGPIGEAVAGTIVLGIVGALVGGWLGRILGFYQATPSPYWTLVQWLPCHPITLTPEPPSVVSLLSMWQTNRALANASRAIERSSSDRRA